MPSTEAGPDFSTRICLEQPKAHNPFVAEQRLIAGYNSVDLWRSCSYLDVLLLMFLGELPTSQQKKCCEVLLVGLMNLGPRHPAIRAAMLAGVSKTGPEELLSLGLLVGSGEQGGALEVIAAHDFIQKHWAQDPANAVDEQWQLAGRIPGFSSDFGEMDPVLSQLGHDLAHCCGDGSEKEIPFLRLLRWGEAVAVRAQVYGQGWNAPGLAAWVGCMLRLGARESLALFQLAIAPGIVAQGMEQTHKPISSNRLLRDDQYDVQSF